MKNQLRVFLTAFVLVGGTALFAYQSLAQFNKTLDNLSASYSAIADIPPIPFSDKTNKEKSSTTTLESISDSATSTDSATPTDPELLP